MDKLPQQLIEVSQIPKSERHPLIFERYAQLAVGEVLGLLTDHEPQNLRHEFLRDHPGTHQWQAERLASGQFQVLITKLASTPAPRVMTNTEQLLSEQTGKDLNGAIWKLEPSARQLDANIIALAPGEQIGEHIGADLDVLLHVVDGAGTLHTETATISLAPGDVVYLPARAQRQFCAGASGLSYLSVHQRKGTLGLMPKMRE